MMQLSFVESNYALVSEVDVLVVGGGTAGAVAGIASARESVTTMIVEQSGFLGGTQTGALVTPMMPNQIDGKPLNRGLDWEINSRLVELSESGTWSDGNRGWFNPEALKMVLEEMAVEAGAELLYYTMFDDAVMDGQTIVGITVLNKAGRGWISAKRIIDATGDADVAFRAGVPCFSGDEVSGVHQSLSVRFSIGNVNLKRLVEFLKSLGKLEVVEQTDGSSVPLIHTAMVWGKGWPLEPIFRKAVDDGVLLEDDGNYFQAFSVAGRPGELFFNCPRIAGNMDGTNPVHLSRAQVAGHKAIRRYLNFCRKYLPGCEEASLVSLANMVGVRESRRIHGEYLLTAEDVLQGRKFDDAIARNNYPIDIHRADEAGVKLIHLPLGTYHEIPYRCLVPKKVENLLVAGRSLSATFEAQGSVRIQSNCRAMGEAAAIGSVLSLREGTSPRKIDGKKVREILRAHGANL